MGLVTDHGGGRETSIVTLPAAGDPDEINPLVVDVIEREAAWLTDNAVPNLFPPPTMLFNVSEVRARRERMAIQKAHVGRVRLAVVL
jgi:hypothetical protein